MSRLDRLETRGREFRRAARSLLRSPLFAVTSVLTLAVCIGANTALFSVVDAVLLRPLPYPEPERLALVITRTPSQGTAGDEDAHTGKTWFLIRDAAKSFDAAAFSGIATGVNFVGGARVEYVQQERVGADFFRVLGVAPALGRGFSPAEDQAGGPAVTILSHGFWERAFHGDAAAVGQTVLLRNEPYVVVGVMPRGFVTPGKADLWLPLLPAATGEGEDENYQIVTRLRAGVRWQEAAAELAVIGHGAFDDDQPESAEPRQLALVPLQGQLTGAVRRPLLVLWAAALFVLLIACVNIAGLLLARGAGRAREFATHLALGAGRAAILRQLLAESVLLALAGGVGGILLGYWALEALRALAHDSLDLWQTIRMDGHVLVVAILASLLTSLVFGLIPAVQVSRTDLRAAIGEGGRGTADRRQRWARRLLVVAEVALGVVLLVGAGLLLRTFVALRSLPPGFDPTHVMTARFSLQGPAYRTSGQVNRLFTDSLARLAAQPGIEAAVGLGLPYERFLRLGFQYLDGPEAKGRGGNTTLSYVSPGYFEVLRVPLLRGRLLLAGDGPGQPLVTVVNEAFVRRYLPDGPPIGRHIQMAGEGREIVGIVGDVQQQAGWGDYGPLGALPAAFIPAAQASDEMVQLVHTWFSPSWVVRTPGPPESAAPIIQRAVEASDPQLPVARFRSMDQLRSGAMVEQRFQAILLGTLSGLALLLAALGVFGLIAQAVVDGRREVGIRLALGATRWRTMRAVALPGILLSLVGVLLGCALAQLAAKSLRHLIWGVQPSDPVTLVGAAVGILVVATAASLLPTLRLVEVDPASTLRGE
jgi:putative ABC transport system permease protein